LDVKLDRPREVAAVVLLLGAVPFDFGRRLALDCESVAGVVERGREVPGWELVFDRPRPAQILPLAPPRACRSLRVRQTGVWEDNYWSVAEVTVLERPEGPRK
jgi:hypothetical protein